MSDRVKLADGKYEVIHDETAYNRGGVNLRALRYGEPWRDLTGDGLVLAMLYRIIELEAALSKAEASAEAANRRKKA